MGDHFMTAEERAMFNLDDASDRHDITAMYRDGIDPDWKIHPDTVMQSNKSHSRQQAGRAFSGDEKSKLQY